MSSVPVVSTGMCDIATISQLLTESGRSDDLSMQWPALKPCNSFQTQFLNWYGENWRLPQMVKIQGLLSGQRNDLYRRLPRNIHSFTGFNALGENELGMVTYSDLSGGLRVPTKPTHIMTSDRLYTGLRIDAKATEIYEIPGLQFPLVKVHHSRSLDFWMTIPNEPLDESGDTDLYRFAVNAMTAKKDLLHRSRGRWAFVEVPEVKATVCREAEWLQGLSIDEHTLRQVLQVCDVEISKGDVWGALGPKVASETLEGPPTLSFDRDFVVWTTHLKGQLVSPVVHVPASIWQEVR